MSSALTDRSRSLLEKAGWHSGRQIDISDLEESLTTVAGYEVFPVVRSFLAEFGRLRITYPYDSESGTTSRLYLDPTVDGVPYAREHSMQRFTRHVGKPICPIGAYNNEILVMDADGRVYLGDGDYVDLIGQNGPDAIENVFRGIDIVITPIATPDYSRIGDPDLFKRRTEKNSSGE